ncbi:MAG TPA: cytochrome C oxidase subunit IV family protein [Polyangia bacterium]|nr:cytochrome C oxidase subunit IV family protein [Polyangia bacterium]
MATTNQPPTSEAEAQAAHAHHGPGRYFLIWALLLGFTVTTVITGRMDLGAVNLPLALAIASIKATLVVLFFMHLSESHGVNRLVFVVSILFVLVLMAGVFGDLLTRFPLSLPSSGLPTTEGPEIAVPLPHVPAP